MIGSKRSVVLELVAGQKEALMVAADLSPDIGDRV
jgi:hypothetical protein